MTAIQDRKRFADTVLLYRMRGMIPSARRFRFGGEKEAAGAAVAVILVGIMEIECGLVIR